MRYSKFAITRKLHYIYKNLAFYHTTSIFNPFFDLFTGGKRRLALYDIEKTFPALRKIDEKYPEIKEELEAILPQVHKMPRYHEIDSDLIYASGRFNRDKSWNVFMLYSYGAKPEANRILCPKTCAVLDEIPDLNQAFFSILEGGKSIPAHSGPTRTYLRYHLALKVPERNPPTIRIKDHYYTWKEGESIFFDDSWEHEIYNQSDDIRAVLIVDVLRPLPFIARQLSLVLKFFGRQIYGRKIARTTSAFPLSKTKIKLGQS